MTWAAQVIHVLRRDLRHFRWYLVAYAITVVLLVARVYRTEESTGYFNASLLLLVGLGMFLVAVAIQADPPVADDALWRATPLEPSVVLAAKLALVVVLLLVGLVGQFAALRAYALGPDDIVASLLQSILPMCRWLTGSMLIAAHTRDARWYLTVLLTAPIALAIVLWFANFGVLFGVSVEIVRHPTALFASLRVATLLMALGVLVLAYTRRVGRRVSMVAAAAMVMLGALVGAGTELVPDARTRAESGPSATDLRVQASLAIDVSDQQRSTVSLRLSGADVSVTDRLLLEWPVLVMRFPDSSEVRLELGSGMSASIDESASGQSISFGQGGYGAVVAEPAQVTGTGAPWPAPRFRELRFTVSSTLTDDQRRAIETLRVKAWIEAHAQLLSARVVAEVPTSVGARSAVPGVRVSVADYRREMGGTERVERVAHLSSLRRSRILAQGPNDGLLAILLGRESRVLHQQMISIGDDLVLPGVSRLQLRFSLVPERWRMRATDRRDGSGLPRATRDSLPGWLDSARVVVVRWENARSARLTSDPVGLAPAMMPAILGGEAMSTMRGIPMND